MRNPAADLSSRYLEFDRRAGELIEWLSEHNTQEENYDQLLFRICEKDAIYETALLIAVLESRNLIQLTGNKETANPTARTNRT